MTDPYYFFGNSVTGKIARSIDWSKTSLGRPEEWPDCLKLILGMMYSNLQPVCLFWGPEYKYFYNDSYIPIVGASKHPWAIGKKGKVVWAEIWDFLLPQINQVMSGGGATWNEDQYLPIIGDDGTPRDAFFTYSYSPVYEPDGKINGVLVTCTETTNRVVAEKKLRESQQSLRLALSSASMGTWEVDLSTSEVKLSEEARSIFGFSKEYENADAAIDDFIHPEDRMHAREVLRAAVESGKPYDDVYRIVRPDGEVRWINSKGQARYDYTGNPVSLAGLTFDITEKREAQLNYERNVDTAPAMLWMTEKDGSCSYLSKQWYENTGQTPETGLGFGWLKATHPEDAERTRQVFEEANRERKSFYLEYRLRQKNGEYRWCIDAGNPRFSDSGEFLGFAGTVIDINDRKNAEIKTEEALQARDEFLSIASHELKTPLTTLKLQVGLQQRLNKSGPGENVFERYQTFLHLTNTQVQRISRLVDDMLDVSRIRTGRLSFEWENIDLCELATDVIQGLSDQFVKSSYDIPVIKKCDGATGYWDRMRVEQIVTNLLTNAIKYGNKKPISVSIEADEKFVSFIVKDQGIGISEENLSKIFNRFERAVNSNEYSGLGLGLYITKQIVLSLKGEINVETKLGEGSTFIVRLPKLV